MAKQKKIQEIDLLPQEEFNASAIGRVLKWLLSTFRYIVITTEMIVMVAFLSRFWLDARSSDLTDAINQKKAVVASYSTFENQFRAAQQKITIFNNFAASNQQLNPVIQNIIANVPNDISLTDVSINNEKISIIGITGNENSAANFITHLNSSALLTGVSLDSLESKQNSGRISFKVIAKIKGRSITTNGS